MTSIYIYIHIHYIYDIYLYIYTYILYIWHLSIYINIYIYTYIIYIYILHHIVCLVNPLICWIHVVQNPAVVVVWLCLLKHVGWNLLVIWVCFFFCLKKIGNVLFNIIYIYTNHHGPSTIVILYDNIITNLC